MHTIGKLEHPLMFLEENYNKNKNRGSQNRPIHRQMMYCPPWIITMRFSACQLFYIRIRNNLNY